MGGLIDTIKLAGILVFAIPAGLAGLGSLCGETRSSAARSSAWQSCWSSSTTI
ncbi:hypothetical protein ACFQMM_15205 [Saliphagus sp. GCM10025308]